MEAMRNEQDSTGGGPGIVDDLTVELNGWAECYAAFGSAQSIIGDCSRRMRAAKTEREREIIRGEVLGFLRRLSLRMLAVVYQGDDVVTESGEKP